MLLQIIDDVNNALNVKAYLAALALVLTIPDICGRAKYGEIGTKKRYIDWYDEYIGAYENGKDATNDNVPSDIAITGFIGLLRPCSKGLYPTVISFSDTTCRMPLCTKSSAAEPTISGFIPI